MQLYNYQDIIYQYIIYARKKIDIFMKCLYSNSFIRLDSFYDYCIAVGMSSLFINLILKTSNYLHMKVLNERISKWAHLSFYQKWF